MAALIRYFCGVTHAPHRDEAKGVPALTIYEGEWAYCADGGDDDARTHTRHGSLDTAAAGLRVVRLAGSDCQSVRLRAPPTRPSSCRATTAFALMIDRSRLALSTVLGTDLAAPR